MIEKDPPIGGRAGALDSSVFAPLVPCCETHSSGGRQARGGEGALRYTATQRTAERETREREGRDRQLATPIQEDDSRKPNVTPSLGPAFGRRSAHCWLEREKGKEFLDARTRLFSPSVTPPREKEKETTENLSRPCF